MFIIFKELTDKVGMMVAILILLFSFDLWSLPLREGDILLQPLDCKLCTLIESEEGGPFSHMGLLVKPHKEWMVLEAHGKVKLTPLSQFLKKTERGGQVLVKRLKEDFNLNFKDYSSYLDKDYDPEFLWDNVDENGVEKYYCSELVTKVLDPLLQKPLMTKPMHFFDLGWLEYFNGAPPIGERGNSPMDFYRDDRFWTMGTFEKGLWIFL